MLRLHLFYPIMNVTASPLNICQVAEAFLYTGRYTLLKFAHSPLTHCRQAPPALYHNLQTTAAKRQTVADLMSKNTPSCAPPGTASSTTSPRQIISSTPRCCLAHAKISE
ncbi:hypothetical protein PMIN06_007283 [Paraphaeosphaeria minitans]